MTNAAQSVATLTITPGGIVERQLRPTPAPLAPTPISSAAIQNMDRALRQYSYSENRLINASSDLLALCGTVRRLDGVADTNVTRAEISRSIIDLKYRIARLDYPPSVAENLCLLFAIVLDEMILTSEWGRDSGWENLSLVANLFGFRDGGDRFYNIADRALMQPKALQEFLQLVYVFLKLGYRGRYLEGQEQERDRLINRLENALDLVDRERPSAPFGRPPEMTKPPKRRIGTASKILVAAAMLMAITGGMLLGQARDVQLSREHLAAQMEATVSSGSPEFVFSSLTGKTEIRVNE